MRTIALVRMAVACTWRSWRWLPPYVITVASLALLYMVPSGAALPAFAVTTVVLVPVTAWLVAATGNVDDEPHQRLLGAATSVARVHLSRLLAGLLLAVPLVVLAPLWPLVIGAVARPRGVGGLVRTVGVGLAAHAVGALLGGAIGTFGHRPVLRRTGGAAIVAVLGTMLIVLAPPLLPFLHALGHDRARSVLWAVPAAAGLAAVAAGVGARIAVRRM